MRTETRKIAGIATMLCGSMVTFGAHAFEQSVQAAEVDTAHDVASGPVEPLVMRDVAPSNDAPDAITQAVVDALSAQKPRAPSDDVVSVPVSYAAPIAVVTPRSDTDEAVSTAPVTTADAANDAVINEASYAVEEPGATSPEHVVAKEAEPAVKPLPVSYAAPIAVAARKADAPREQPAERRAQAKPMQHEASTQARNATPTPPPVSPAHAESIASGTMIDKAPVSYAAPIAVPQASQSVRNDTPPGENRVVKTQATTTEDPNWSSKTTVAISEEKLDTMRGGFDVANGLKVSFGISRMAVVNGNLVTQTSFNIPDLSNMTTQQAQALAAANMGSLLQNGVGNVAQQGSVQGLSGAVIQNTLSNQNIQALTTINASVNSLGLFKNMNLGATLNSALMNSVRPR